MNVKGILKHATILTAIFLISITVNTKTCFAITNVNVVNTPDVHITNTYLPFRPYGSYDLYSYSGRTIQGGYGSGWDIYGNISSQLAYIHKFQDLSNETLSNIYTRQGLIYNNILTPLYSNITYYLPVMSSAIQTIGTSTDLIRTDVSLSKASLSNIESDVQDILDALNNSQYMDVQITADEKDTVQTGIGTMLGFIPLDDDDKPYTLDLTQLIDDWSNNRIRTDIRRKTTQYYDLYN